MLETADFTVRERAARLARQARRRAYLRRLLLRGLAGAIITGLGLIALLLLAQRARPRLVATAHQHASVVALRRPGAGGAATRPHGVGTPSHPVTGATLTLNPVPVRQASGPTTLRVTLADRAGAPLPGITIWLTISGPLPFAAAATTNAAGLADFHYAGTAGPYTIHVTATADGLPLAQSTMRVGGTPPVVRTTAVIGRFYPSDGRCTFDAPAGTPPMLVRSFPGINFAGRPLASYPNDPGQAATVVAGGGHTVGSSPLHHFNAALTGTLLVARAGDILFTVLVDDAFNFGVGGGASRVRGAMSNPPASGLTALARLPVVGAFNQGHLEATTTVMVRFPRSGRFPYEFDWAECAGGGEGLRLSTAGQFLPTVP